ncbi:MAG: NAD(P)/FAD-dependent oxidoreductase [Planctomycetota bacterium]
MRENRQVVVIGGGPAGAAAAARLGRGGHDVLVVESERFPRFHIGESLLPLGNYVFDAIGCREKIEAEGFHAKRGAQLRSSCGAERVVFDFEEQGIRPARTVQVHRDRFDQLLLEHAQASGAELVQARVRDVALEDGAASGGGGVRVRLQGPEVGERIIHADAVIDASGRSGVLAKQLGVRCADPDLNKASVHAHFEDVLRDDGERGGDTRIVCLPELGWLWLIPLGDRITSVGVVIDIEAYRKQAKGDLGAVFWRAIRSSPLATELLGDAKQATPFRAESGFSYRASAYAGDRWFLAGDAGSFLDPVWSTGVQLALQGGVEAADAVVAGYLGDQPRPEQAIRRYERRVRRRYQFVRRFVTGFYQESVRDLLFSPRPYFGIHRAVTRVLAGGFELGWLDRRRIGMFFLLARVQARLPLVPRVAAAEAAAANANANANATAVGASRPSATRPSQGSDGTLAAGRAADGGGGASLAATAKAGEAVLEQS